MMEPLSITCPYCWQRIDIEEPAKAETTVEFVTDCEVCCRPILVTAEWEPDEDTPYLTVEPES
jgi:hypothetical protein|tara:strand:- start:1282 stop:1470 length:189 start_codon:yes stop_codon:yes gene_type:complete